MCFQILVIIVVIVLDAFGAYGVAKLKTEYNVIWYLRPDSYNVAFLNELQRQFPESGERVQLYLLGDIKYWENHKELMRIYDIINSDNSVVEDSVRLWYPLFYSEQCEQGRFNCSTGDKTVQVIPSDLYPKGFQSSNSKGLCSRSFRLMSLSTMISSSTFL